MLEVIIKLMSGHHMTLAKPHETVLLGGTPEAQQATEVMMDDEYYQATYGITLAEAQQTVRYGNKEALLGEVLAHKECPLGGWVQAANLEGGRQAVAEKFSLFGQLATEFKVVLEEPKQVQKKN